MLRRILHQSKQTYSAILSNDFRIEISICFRKIFALLKWDEAVCLSMISFDANLIMIIIIYKIYMLPNIQKHWTLAGKNIRSNKNTTNTSKWRIKIASIAKKLDRKKRNKLTQSKGRFTHPRQRPGQRARSTRSFGTPAGIEVIPYW